MGGGSSLGGSRVDAAEPLQVGAAEVGAAKADRGGAVQGSGRAMQVPEGACQTPPPAPELPTLPCPSSALPPPFPGQGGGGGRGAGKVREFLRPAAASVGLRVGRPGAEERRRAARVGSGSEQQSPNALPELEASLGKAGGGRWRCWSERLFYGQRRKWCLGGCQQSAPSKRRPEPSGSRLIARTPTPL